MSHAVPTGRLWPSKSSVKIPARLTPASMAGLPLCKGKSPPAAFTKLGLRNRVLLFLQARAFRPPPPMMALIPLPQQTLLQMAELSFTLSKHAPLLSPPLLPDTVLL